METYRHYSNASRFIFPVVDTLLIFAAFRLASFIMSHGHWTFGGLYPALFAVFALLWWVLSVQITNVYRVDHLITYGEKMLIVLRTFLIHAVLLIIGAVALEQYWVPARYLTMIYALSATAVITGRLLLTFGYRTYRRQMAHTASRYVIVGAGENGQNLYNFLASHSDDGNEFIGFFADEPVPDGLRSMVRGGVEDLKEYCRQMRIDEIYFALPLDRRALIEDLSSFADKHLLSFRIVPDFSGTVRKDVSVYFYENMPILTIRREPLRIRTNQLLKRIFDIAFSLTVILFVFPIVLPILALLIKLDSAGPVFFTQMRPGKRNQLFPCLKLRTMSANHGSSELQATKNDYRITRVGAYLRKYNLDELPQFFNVLRGDMSVVGPRPNMISQLEQYSKRISQYHMRHAVMPGITGYAQVNGYRGETREPGTMEKRVEYDLKYMENWSFGLDMKIIGQTVLNMVRGEKNAY